MKTAYSSVHPVLPLLFFLGAAVSTMMLSDPVYLGISALSAVLCAAASEGRDALRLWALLPFCALAMVLTPLLSPFGKQLLFTVLGRPVTWEALQAGADTGLMLLAVLVWLHCFSHTVSSDQLTALLGGHLPALSLLVVMILRLVPAYGRKARQIDEVRRGLMPESRLRHASGTLSALTGWALEGSIVTADSMRARGYGVTRPTRFHPLRFTRRDGCLTLSAAAAGAGAIALSHTPWGAAAYAFFLLLPSLYQLKEVLAWHRSRSNI